MIVDTSAVIAILREEAEAETLAIAMERASLLRMSAANYLEAAIVIDGSRDPIASRHLDEFMEEAGISIEPVTFTQAKVAREAYRDFGKGSGHSAKLNFGDCFAYALARETKEPLLFKGEGFTTCGIESALPNHNI